MVEAELLAVFDLFCKGMRLQEVYMQQLHQTDIMEQRLRATVHQRQLDFQMESQLKRRLRLRKSLE